MKLWIRSQDKTKLVKVDNISYLDVADDYEKEVHSLWNDCKGVLGIYKTKERALGVLDEIQKVIEPRGIVKQDKHGIEVNMISVPIVYNMPKE